MNNRLWKAPLFMSCCVAALLMSPVADAQQKQDTQGQQQMAAADTTWVDIRTWDTAHLYKGWSAEALLDEEVYDSTGEVVGEVEDFIIGPDGKIQKVVVEGGGFLDIGDSHLAVPWEKVTRVGAQSITVPVTEENLHEHSLFENVDDMPAKPKNFRLSNLLGDYATADGIGYGYVKDVIFNAEGKIDAVIVEPAYGYGYGRGPVAFPYYSGRYDPYTAYYSVPYGTEELKDLKPFNYGELG